MTFTPYWHVSVGFEISGRTDGSHCGYIGLCTRAGSQEEGWRLAVDWLRKFSRMEFFLLYSWQIKVRYF